MARHLILAVIVILFTGGFLVVRLNDLIGLAARKNKIGPLMAELKTRLTEVLKDISRPNPHLQRPSTTRWAIGMGRSCS
jgi:hypothetical protein